MSKVPQLLNTEGSEKRQNEGDEVRLEGEYSSQDAGS